MHMTDAADLPTKNAAMARLKKADARVRKHEQERAELEAAIQDARRAGWTPTQIGSVVHYDRNHIGRLLKKAKLTTPRPPKTEN